MADPTTIPLDPLTAATPLPDPASIQAAAAKVASDNQIQPLTNDYDESKGVAGRVASITSADSPLMQQAATSGIQQAAARGLTNSSLAGQAAQSAVLSAATPIASADAGLYSQQALANQSAVNTAKTANAGNAVSLGSTALQLGNSNQQQAATLAQQQGQFNVSAGQSQQQINNQIAQFAQQLGLSTDQLQLSRDTLNVQQQQFLDNLNQQKAIADQQASTQLAVANLSSTTQQAVASTEAQWHNQIQSSSNISAAWGALMTNIAAIQTNASMDQATKETLVNNNVQSFQAFANFWNTTAGSDADVTPLLNFNVAVTPGANTVVGPGTNAPPATTQNPGGGYDYYGGGNSPGGGGGGGGD